ncbi:antigen WC1.1-like [Vidua chalybeata]|uniref:antigen WC1.1-like n=1 Tax=Vidua chalybeata TaxID=81927 RepID=UPI0023A79B08|nr:antigen WC1.1-like [Vidua chalybeata]
MKLQGQWGSVTDDTWDLKDAEVVCQHVGCGSASGAYYALDTFGLGVGLISLALVDCSGNEATLLDCKIRGWGPYNSSIHDLDIAVFCQGFSRLVGGDGACAGRLEVRQGRAWVGVCEDQVDMKAAQVVCRELGCGEALAIPGRAGFGRGSGSFWDRGFQCNGSEPLLSACARRPAHRQGCTGPASVTCSSYTGFRLGNSSSGCSGRVEVAVRGTWGSVCASEWDLADAHVLCRQLGCGRAFSVPPGGSFGSGEGPLRPDAFGCSGSERHPGECPVAVLGKPPCAPGNAAAVNCSGSVESLRLVEGETRCDGFLEMAVSTGAWHRVPGEVSPVRNFSKVCWELGCGGLDRTDAVHGQIYLLDVNTTEKPMTERVIPTIMDTTPNVTTGTIGDDNFGYEREFVTTAAADIPHGSYTVCSGGCCERGRRWRCPRQPPQPMPSVPTGSRQVRLVGSSGRCAGRVEVYSGGSWSSVCQEGWDLQDAAVVCRQLGCGRALDAPSSARSGAVPGPLWPYIPDCSGSEESLWECGRTERRQCGRGGGAGAVCSGQCRAPPDQGPAEAPGGSWPCRDPPAPLAEQLLVQLAGGHGRCRGYLEVSYNGTWGRVCASGTSSGTAAAVCRQLGCGDQGSLSPVPSQQPSLAWLAWVGCEDGARSLWGCPSAPWHLQSCGTDGYAQVECEEDSDGTSDGHSAPYPEGATSTGSSARACIPHSGLAGIPLPSVPARVPTGVPSRTPSAVALGTVPVPTVLCVVLGTLLCLALGALALLLCRARARHRGPGKAADATSIAVYEELDYKAMPEYQEVPTPPGSLSEGWVKKLPYYTGDSVEGSDSEAAPDPPAQPEQGSPDGYDDALDVPQEAPAPSTGDISEGVARQKWICVLPTGGISSPPSSPGATKDPTDQPPGHMDYDDVGCSALGTLPWLGWEWLWLLEGLVLKEGRSPEGGERLPAPLQHPAVAGQPGHGPCLRHVVLQEVPDLQGGLQSPERVQILQQGLAEAVRAQPGRAGGRRRGEGSGELRLVGGGGRCAGRVEVKHGGEWGSVCVFDYDGAALWAVVVCRQLGCGRVARASPYAPFGQGSGRIWLQPFFCLGTEDTLEECPHFGWGRHFCGHERDVGVTCTDAVELRLAGGSSACAGRVEVKLQGQWGSVADDNWDMEDAEVVCQHVGCGSASGAYYARDTFGLDVGLISLALVDCSGKEATLLDCTIRGWGPYNSSIHEFDTAVFCQGRSWAWGGRGTSCTSLDTAPAGFSRLVGGDGACAGRLEVRQGRAWVGVCEDQVDMKAAQVVCRELGCGEALAIPGRAGFGRGSGSFWDRGFQCNGSEPLLSACARRPAHRQGCTGPASVTCSSYTGFRLGNSSSGCSGRVEVAVRGTWGSVCASEWDLADAHVLCRQLGCGRAFSVPPGGSFGSGEGPLRPDAFGCSGSERHPGECPVAVLGKPPCAPGNAAAVNCSGSVESLRLVEGETRCDGFLEMAVSTGAWHRVPGEVSPARNFSKVCWELGCGGLDRTDAVHGQIYLLDVNTTEKPMTERVIPTIMDTTRNVTTGTISDDNFGYEREFVTTAAADIPHGSYTVCSGGCCERGRRWRCPRQPPQPMPSVPTGSRQVRLVGSSGRCAGRVEVYSGGSWSSVCQEGWDLQDAAVVCRQLGCGRALDAPSSARSGAVPGPLWPYIPDCSGSEESLWECGRTERRQCGRGGGAGAVCSGQCRAPPDQGPAEAPGGSWPCRDPPAPLAEQLSVQLAGGHGRCRGYLEVSYNGTWGRVCASGTSSGTAAAVCRQLGCGDQGSLSPVPSQQPSLAWLAWVGCEDGARSLWGCPSAPWHLQSCGTDGYAQVECEEDSDGTSDGHSAPYPEGATSTGSSARACIPHSGLAGIPLPSVPARVPTGVPSRTPSAVALGTVPVPTVLCVVLGMLLCLSLGALALLLCRARARRRGPGKAADATSDAIYEELDYKAMPEYQEVPTPPGSLSEGWVKKLPYYTGDSVEGSDTMAAPDPPAQPEQGSPDGYDDALDVPQEAPAPSTGDISEGVARQKWICVLPTGGISSPPSSPGATKDPTDQPPGHMDYDDVGCSALGTLP